jgi:hypothetical protein
MIFALTLIVLFMIATVLFTIFAVLLGYLIGFSIRKLMGVK